VTEHNSVEQTPFFAHQILRDGQKEMLADSINALANNGHHLAAAPTGIGKTAAALAAALEALSNSDDNKKIFFLTGRQSQHRIVIETLRTINNSLGEQKIRCVDLIGRQSMCLELDSFTGKCNCEPGLPGNLKKIAYDDLSEIILENPLHVDEVVAKARSRVLCPWKVLRNAAKEADIIVCDYNHLFIDTVRNSSLPALGVDLEDIIIIVDEAHNLPSRIRTGLERRLTTRILQHARFELEEFIDEMGSKAQDSWKWAMKTFKKFEQVMTKKFNEWRSEIESGKNEKRIFPSEFLKTTLEGLVSNEWDDSPESALSRLSLMLKNVTVEQDSSIKSNEKELNCWRISALFETILQFQNKKGLVLVFNNEHIGRLSCHLLDPSIIAKPVFSNSAGSILMSGTLYPPKMYSDILGLSALKNVTCQEYSSPFESHNKPISIATNVTTRYKQRGPENTQKIREHIYAVAKEVPGHIAVFAPSYRQLEEFVDDEGWPNRIVIKESSEWKKSEVDQIIPDLEKYRRNNQKILLAGVFGGKLSEGIDYSNNILDAVVCIGIPVAPPSVFSDALREFLETKFGRNKGWLYGSTQPAVNSVIQAMGRPIRSSKDRAFIVLLDSRHIDPNYRRCHPSEFSPLICNDSEVTRRYIARFFARNQTRS
jgi:DNA excision repair protein ERCC-2